MKKYVLFFAMCLFAVKLSAQGPLHTFIHNGIERSYLINVPPTYDGSKPFALIIAIHGYTSSATLFYSSLLNAGFFDQSRTQTFEYITVLPNGTRAGDGNTGWNAGELSGFAADDVGFISALIDSIKTQYNINPERVYATGHSMGGFMSYRLAVGLPDKIAAIAPVEGLSMMVNLENIITKPVPILHICALDDQSVPYTGWTNFVFGVDSLMKIWRHANQCLDKPDTIYNENGVYAHEWKAPETGANIALYIFDAGGHTWLTTPLNSTDLVLDFFYNHPKLLSSRIKSPVNKSNYQVNDNIELTVETKPDDSITKIEYFSNNIKIGESNSKPYSFTWNAPAAGEFVLSAKAVHSDNTITISGNPAYINVFASNTAIGKSSSSSSDRSNKFSSSRALDGDFTTKWISSNSDTQWIKVDLQDLYKVDGVTLIWDFSFAIEYRIEISTDDQNWTPVFNTTKGDGVTDFISFTAKEARYVRMYGIEKSMSGYGYTLFEFQIHGTPENPTSVESLIEKPNTFSLLQNYPNPFNPETVISYTVGAGPLSAIIKVELKVFDVLGNEVATLVNKEQSPGNYEVKFDGRNLSSGIYFYKINAGNFIQTKKMILMR